MVSKKNYTDFVEVGVWKGHSLVYLGKLLNNKKTEKQNHGVGHAGFDSGVPGARKTKINTNNVQKHGF